MPDRELRDLQAQAVATYELGGRRDWITGHVHQIASIVGVNAGNASVAITEAGIYEIGGEAMHQGIVAGAAWRGIRLDLRRGPLVGGERMLEHGMVRATDEARTFWRSRLHRLPLYDGDVVLCVTGNLGIAGESLVLTAHYRRID